jgi:single-stranded DNA-specific DHH superfamily exonuclease
MAKYQRPVLLLNKVIADTEMFWEGSGRGYDKSKFNNFKEFLNNSELVEWAQGHPNAFGTKIQDNNF